MKRATVNFFIDLISLLDLFAMVATGLIIKYILPPGSGGLGKELHDGQGRIPTKTLLSLTRHEWGSIHYYLAAIFIILMAIHIILHWAWIKSYCKSLRKNHPNQ